jgi:hypothetical protein
MADSHEYELGEKEGEAGDSEKDKSVAEVRYADWGLRRWGALGVGKEEGLVFRADGWPEAGHGNGGFF